MLTVGAKAVSDLYCQFTGWCQNKHQWAIGSRRRLLFAELVQNWQSECSRFPGSCLSAAQHISTGQSGRDGFCLDGRGYFVFLSNQCTLQRADQFNFSKSLQWWSLPWLFDAFRFPVTSLLFPQKQFRGLSENLQRRTFNSSIESGMHLN